MYHVGSNHSIIQAIGRLAYVQSRSLKHEAWCHLSVAQNPQLFAASQKWLRVGTSRIQVKSRVSLIHNQSNVLSASALPLGPLCVRVTPPAGLKVVEDDSLETRGTEV